MVDDTRMLEAALGTGQKNVEDNEVTTVVLQRRCVRAARDLQGGTTLSREDLVVLRPAPSDALPAHELDQAVGKQLKADLAAGQDLKPTDIAT
jgi:N-acetylneuraminate synthase